MPILEPILQHKCMFDLFGPQLVTKSHGMSYRQNTEKPYSVKFLGNIQN